MGEHQLQTESDDVALRLEAWLERLEDVTKRLESVLKHDEAGGSGD